MDAKIKKLPCIYGTVGHNDFHQIPEIKVLIDCFQEGLERKGIKGYPLVWLYTPERFS